MTFTHSKVITIFSPLPPSRCGIATYAGEHRLRLETDGYQVRTISMLPDSEAETHIDLTSFRSCLKALVHAWQRDRCELVVHYADGLFFPRQQLGPVSRRICRLLHTQLLRTMAQRSSQSRIVIHEILTRTDLPWFNNWTRRFAFCAFDEIAFHTDSMRRQFLGRFPEIPREKTVLVEHTQFMLPHYRGSRNEARAELGLSACSTIFLCSGFLHRYKGFHDAVEAFSLIQTHSAAAELHLVGSSFPNQHECQAYADELASLCANVPQVFLHQDYLDDRAFDRWLAAADVLLLPYLGVASSGVGARASLYDTRLIIRNLTNLVEQFPEAEIFATTAELRALLERHSLEHAESQKA